MGGQKQKHDLDWPYHVPLKTHGDTLSQLGSVPLGLPIEFRQQHKIQWDFFFWGKYVVGGAAVIIINRVNDTVNL